MNDKEIINWLLDGDPSIQYQTRRDLLGEEQPDIQSRIAKEGWGADFLSRRRENGHWGLSFYQPKWLSTHYTLLDLRCLEIEADQPQIRETLSMIFRDEKGYDGGINPSASINQSDVCINGMGLYYGCYFAVDQDALISVVDFILGQRMKDGGFNCRLNRSGANHSSLHTTISTAEGLAQYRLSGYSYRLDEVIESEAACREFMLEHRLYKSDKTGNVINPKFLRLPNPSRWYYDILRALDYFRFSGAPYDERMYDALDELLKKRRKDRTWPVQAAHPGAVHFTMEKAGTSSRWNTLKALRIGKFYNQVRGE